MQKEVKTEKKSLNNQLTSQLLMLLHKFFFVIVLIIFAAILVVGYVFLIQPKYQVAKEKQQSEAKQKNAENEKYRTYLEKLFQYRNEYNQISQADKEKIDAMIAGKYLPETVFADMEKLVFSQGMILNSIDVKTDESGEKKMGGIGEATITLEISGISYEGLKQLLAVIENSMRLMDVKKINFSPMQNSASLEISTYYLK
jgi:Tfp pilus assembly protein PilO